MNAKTSTNQTDFFRTSLPLGRFQGPHVTHTAEQIAVARDPVVCGIAKTESPQTRVGRGGASWMPPQQRNSIEMSAPCEWKP